MHLTRLLPVTAATLAAAGVALAQPDAGRRARLALDADAPLFAAANLRPGESRSACTTVANDGSASGRAALYARGMSGGLAPYLRLTVARGTSCDGAGEVVFRGRLSEFPARLADALLAADPWSPGERHVYRFTLTLTDDPAAEGLSASWDWRLAVDSLAAVAWASSSAQPACTRVQLAGAGRGRARVLQRRRLRLRTARPSAATVTIRARVKGRATVGIRLNATPARPVRRRPYRVRFAAAHLRPGVNRVRVVVQRRPGRARGVTVKLRVTPTHVAGRTVCVVSA